MKRSGSTTLNLNKKFKPMDAQCTIEHQWLQTVSSTTTNAPTTSSSSIEQSRGVTNSVGVNSGPSHDHLYALQQIDLWSPD